MSKHRRRKPKNQRIVHRLRNKERDNAPDIVGRKPDGPHFIGIATYPDGKKFRQYIQSERDYNTFIESATKNYEVYKYKTLSGRIISRTKVIPEKGVVIQVTDEGGKHYNKNTLLQQLEHTQRKFDHQLCVTDFLKSWGINIPALRREWYDRLELVDGNIVGIP